MLTTTTQVPTVARGALRAFIKGQPNWFGWISAKGTKSNAATNSQLLEYAIEFGLEAPVLSILSQATSMQAMQKAHDEFGSDMVMLPDAEGDAADRGEMTGTADMIAVANILAPVDAFLSPLVKAELEKALAPVIVLANKPAVQIEKIVERFTVQTLAPIATGALPYAVKDKVSTLGATFGIRGQYAKFPVQLWDAHGAAPQIDPFYVPDAELIAVITSAFDDGINVWAAGPSGSGKTTTPIQIAAATGRPCVKFGFTHQTEIADLHGGTAVMPDGSTAWQDGAFVQAIKRPGTVIVLDELDRAPAGVQTAVQLVADQLRTMTLPTGEVVTCAPGVVFVVAANSKGFGDDTGQYHGTHMSSAALVNRFGVMVEVDYMSKADEARALVNHTKCSRAAADSLADFMARARKLPEMENVVLSLRQMVAFTTRVQRGFNPKLAAKVAFLTRLPATERAALDALFSLTWFNDYQAALTGTPTTGETVPAASVADSPAARAFDDNVRF